MTPLLTTEYGPNGQNRCDIDVAAGCIASARIDPATGGRPLTGVVHHVAGCGPVPDHADNRLDVGHYPT